MFRVCQAIQEDKDPRSVPGEKPCFLLGARAELASDAAAAELRWRRQALVVIRQQPRRRARPRGRCRGFMEMNLSEGELLRVNGRWPRVLMAAQRQPQSRLLSAALVDINPLIISPF